MFGMFPPLFYEVFMEQIVYAVYISFIKIRRSRHLRTWKYAPKYFDKLYLSYLAQRVLYLCNKE